MSEKLIPISKRQHDAIQGIADTIAANREQLATVATVILLGLEEVIPKFGVVGARMEDGAPVLVLSIPDEAPKT